MRNLKLTTLHSFYIVLIMFSLVLLSKTIWAQPAEKETIEGDPMVKITTLPNDLNLNVVVPLISKEVSEKTGLAESFITYYWQFFEYIYCPGCEGAEIENPVFVDLYIPAFITDDELATIMISMANAIANCTDYNLNDVFIHTHIAEKKQLFIMGNLVTNWKQVGGPDE